MERDEENQSSIGEGGLELGCLFLHLGIGLCLYYLIWDFNPIILSVAIAVYSFLVLCTLKTPENGPTGIAEKSSGCNLFYLFLLIGLAGPVLGGAIGAFFIINEVVNLIKDKKSSILNNPHLLWLIFLLMISFYLSRGLVLRILSQHVFFVETAVTIVSATLLIHIYLNVTLLHHTRLVILWRGLFLTTVISAIWPIAAFFGIFGLNMLPLQSFILRNVLFASFLIILELIAQFVGNHIIRRWFGQPLYFLFYFQAVGFGLAVCLGFFFPFSISPVDVSLFLVVFMIYELVKISVITSVCRSSKVKTSRSVDKHKK